MQSGFRIGRIFGINIVINWSWLLIFLLITWSLAAQVSELAPAWGIIGSWGVGIGAAVLFFGSLLAHELAHSLAARARGIPVRRITLFMFGGVSNIQREPNSPGEEFLIAIVGPITSFVAGFVFWIAAVLLSGSMNLSVLTTNALSESSSTALPLLMWLGSVNLVIGAFNLLPGFPLDGGRVLRAGLWSLTDDLPSATKWASLAGQGISWLMIFAGVGMIFGLEIPYFGTGFASGLWLVFIGWFLNDAAVQNYRKVLIDDVLEDISVEELMRTNPTVVAADTHLNDVVYSQILKSDEVSFPVVEDGVLAGMVSLDDIRTVPREEWEAVTVADIMKSYPEISTTRPDADAVQAVAKLTQNDLRQLPVVDGKTLLGVIRRKDIIRWMQFQATP